MKTMTSQKLSCCLLLTMNTFLVLTKSIEAQPVPMSQYCRNCAIPDLCNKVVNGATNWNEAMVKSIDACTQIAYRIQNVTNDFLPQITGVEPQTKTSIQTTCKEAIDSVVSDLEDAKNALNKNDPGSMISNLSAFYTDCADALEQFGIKFLPLTEVVGRYKQFMSVALSVANTQQ